MLCYRDMTFCDCEDCKEWDKCDRALTDKVKAGAVMWMGKDAPIAVYMKCPACYIKTKPEGTEDE